MLSTVRARLVLLVLIAALPASGLAVWAYLEARQHAGATVRADALQLAQQAAATQEQVVVGARQLLAALAQLPSVQDRDRGACETLFARLLPQYPFYADLAATDPEGRVFCSTRPSPDPVSVASRSYFRRAMESRGLVVSQYTVGLITGRPLLVFAHPTLDASGQPRGIVVATLDLDWLAQVIGRIPRPAGASIVVFDASGTVVVRHPEPDRWVGRAFPDVPFIRAALAGRAGVIESPGLDGVSRLFGVATVANPAAGLFAAVGLSKDGALAPVTRTFELNLAGLVLVTGLAVGAAWIFGDRLIARRVGALTGAVARLAAGDHAARAAPADGADELGRLAQAFNQMAAAEEARVVELKRAMEALRPSEERFRLVVESAPNAIVVVNRHGTIVLVNSQTERLFGYSRSDLLGQPVEVLVPPRFRDRHQDHRAGFQVEPQTRQMGAGRDLYGLRRDGSEFPTEISLTPTEADEGLLVVSWIIDITERRHAEDARRRTQTLEEENRLVREASRLKSEFLANMSHELRTPLNGIIGFAELMHDGKLGPVSTDHKEYLGDILTSARHLLQLINDVLDLAKVESGTMEFRPEPVDPEKLVGEVRDILRALAARKRITLEARVDAGLGLVVTDPGKLKQVLYNYLSNALKFTPDEGCVTVRIGSEGPDRFRIEVEDSGIGIRPEDQGRLFVEFQQLDSSLAKQVPGTGLGLALTKRIVEAQGGHVGVESAPGRGSVFFAVLPRTAHPAVAAGAGGEKAAARSRPGAPTVLVVEDDVTDRAWLARTLTDAGYAVEVAATGAEAVARARERSYDAVTLDILLPDAIGRDVLTALRADGRNRDTPVIVVTVVAEREAAAGFPVHDYFVKPVSAADLLDSLARAGVTPGAGRTVLLVDDDPGTLRLAEVALTPLGYRVFTATDGAAGLRAAEAHVPAAVVLDLVMPTMDGFEFLAAYRGTDHGRDTPVIVWTAKDLTAEEEARLDRTVERIVAKRHGGTALLLEALEDALGHARPGEKP